MRAVLQRVSRAEVRVDEAVVGSIGAGLLVLLGVGPSDTSETAAWMADRIAGLRIFADADGKMNLSVRDVGGGVLVVSQFTLYGDAARGRRPGFSGAAPPTLALPLYEAVCEELERLGVPTERGVFGAHMEVSLLNDGPVTLLLESP
jgi:D-tyrosyl-tRNA(Tyr) deacylase